MAGSKDPRRNIRETISACASSFLTCADRALLSPHSSLSICSSRSLWPQPISPCTFVIFYFCFLLFFLMILQRHLANVSPQLLSDTWFTIIFTHSVCCLSTFLIMSFDVQKFLMLMKLKFFFFCCLCFLWIANVRPWRFTLFSSKFYNFDSYSGQ